MRVPRGVLFAGNTPMRSKRRTLSALHPNILAASLAVKISAIFDIVAPGILQAAQFRRKIKKGREFAPHQSI